MNLRDAAQAVIDTHSVYQTPCGHIIVSEEAFQALKAALGIDVPAFDPLAVACDWEDPEDSADKVTQAAFEYCVEHPEVIVDDMGRVRKMPSGRFGASDS